MIRLVEYRNAVVALDDDEAAELAGLTRGSGAKDGRPRVIERVAPAGAGTYEVQAGPYVGRFQLRGGRGVDIASRFPFADLSVLLGLGRRATLLDEAATGAAGGSGLMDIVALAFVREAERIAGQGPPRSSSAFPN
ncbi:hypothetical protein JIG36_41545 [Actinoplanes sp. LDG1-06]|uniref:Uncharacterized protein n=1 Tax=Paractinoplanes ovalisporus TaxID=2810368 RepID=A0ABS2AQ68_9ACTN|nr:hypothetical protein [Actinoplanes ovalisporus]MBM2622007.1 hypothetical protein [Actinoplanes ovalisporus]